MNREPTTFASVRRQARHTRAGDLGQAPVFVFLLLFVERRLERVKRSETCRFFTAQVAENKFWQKRFGRFFHTIRSLLLK